MNDASNLSESYDRFRTSEFFEMEVPLSCRIDRLTSSIDIDCQLEAIRGLLRRNRDAEFAHKEEIQKSGANWSTLEEWDLDCARQEHRSLLNAGLYQNAAHSMAAVGMLAPLYETAFTQCFHGLGRLVTEKSETPQFRKSERWDSANVMVWDCHYVYEKGQIRKDFVKGVMQIAEGIDLQLPADIAATLNALFGYRNKMFHNGFEWPEQERSKFAARIKDEQWPQNWFDVAEVEGQPWIYYMTNDFIEHCIARLEEVVLAFGQLASKISKRK